MYRNSVFARFVCVCKWTRYFLPPTTVAVPMQSLVTRFLPINERSHVNFQRLLSQIPNNRVLKAHNMYDMLEHYFFPTKKQKHK